MAPPARRRTPTQGTGDEWVKIVTAQETAPTTVAHGVDCAAFDTLALSLAMDNVTSYTVEIYAWNGSAWVPSEEDKITESSGSVVGLNRNYDVAALIRVAVRITAISADGITRSIRLA